VTPLRVGVWGAGAWGEKHVRVWRELSSEGLDLALAGVYDLDPARARQVAETYGCVWFETPQALLAEVDAVSITTPTVAHRLAAEEALAAGVHALVEKPLAVTTAEADAILAAAERNGRVLRVGHVERFNPAMTASRDRVREPKFVEAHRLAVFQPRSLDIDVVFDLMIHDIDLVLEATGQTPESISAVGVAVLSESEDIANARLEFPDGCVANLTASRVSQERLRRIRFFQSDSYLSVDLFGRSAEFLRVDPNARAALAPGGAGLMAALAGIQRRQLGVPEGEPLKLELAAFARDLRGESTRVADGRAGREALKVAEAVREAMRRRMVQWTAS
jgi:predicted dehydrogenase